MLRVHQYRFVVESMLTHKAPCRKRYIILAFPYLSKTNRKRLQYLIAQPLWGDIEASVLFNTLNTLSSMEDSDSVSFGPRYWQCLGDTLREALSILPPDDQVCDSITNELLKLDYMRNNYLMHQSVLSQRAYSMDLVINTVVVSGLLRDVADIQDVLRQSIAITTPEPNLRQYLQDQLDQPNSCLSITTAKRHKLTLHMAWCLSQQAVYKGLMEGDAVASWRTLDLSPLAGPLSGIYREPYALKNTCHFLRFGFVSV